MRGLSANQQFRLSQWLSKNSDRIVRERMAQKDAAKHATNDLGFSVTEYAIRSLTTGDDPAVPIQWNAKGANGSSPDRGIAITLLLKELADAIGHTWSPESQDRMNKIMSKTRVEVGA